MVPVFVFRFEIMYIIAGGAVQNTTSDIDTHAETRHFMACRITSTAKPDTSSYIYNMVL